MTNELYDRILSLLPSADLKETIQRTGYRVPDRDLLTVTWRYAPDYDTRLGLLRELGECFEGKLKNYISGLIDTQRQILESFLHCEEGTVYELFLKETSDAYEEGNLCRSYEEALRMIPLIYQEYPFCKEREETRYQIVKRRISLCASITDLYHGSSATEIKNPLAELPIIDIICYKSGRINLPAIIIDCITTRMRKLCRHGTA